MTERLHFHFSLFCIGEGNGNPLQCSCLENPRDGETWWAAISGVAQSRTRLKWLSSSSSSTSAQNIIKYFLWGGKYSDFPSQFGAIAFCLQDLIFAFGVLAVLHDRPTPVAVIRNVKSGGTATVLTKDRRSARCVEGKRSAAIEMACVVLVPAAIMVKVSFSVDGPLSFHVGNLDAKLYCLLLSHTSKM